MSDKAILKNKEISQQANKRCLSHCVHNLVASCTCIGAYYVRAVYAVRFSDCAE